MIFEIFTHEYFWLSFLPIALMSGGFWLLYFDRSDDIKEPLILLILALLAGALSALLYSYVGEALQIENFWLKVLGEEFCKVLFALFVMEILRTRFKTISQGIMYGFSVGIGFAVLENIVYLGEVYDVVSFNPEFWLTFQGRFWSSTLLHGITTATFGLFYAGAYLSATAHKKQKQSPLTVFFIPPSFYQLLQVLTLHVTRQHLVFAHNKKLGSTNVERINK